MSKPFRERADPLQFFIHAGRFEYACDYLALEASISKKTLLSLTINVISAFTSELYLKTLLLIHTSSAPHGHDLSNLFRNLPMHIRKNIDRRWDAQFNAVKCGRLAILSIY